MSIGAIVRKLAGPLEEPLCRAYRRIFVDADAVMAQVAKAIPHGAHVVDIGGGDGVMLDALLRHRLDLTATMTDIRPDIGASLSEGVRHRVTILRDTPAAKCAARGDAVILADVLHHVPPVQRAGLIREAMALAKPGGILIVKEFEPRGFVAWLGYMADKYISGDRGVQFIGADELQRLVGSSGTHIVSGAHPNYALAFVA
jgi:2-polyprenyl-3-methyl-5-hydroxy-6-metoxy-1,4-benzoquinol methylase